GPETPEAAARPGRELRGLADLHRHRPALPALPEAQAPMKTAAPYVHYALLAAIALLCVFPFWWTLVTALSTEGNIFAYPPTFWPKQPSLENFAEVFRVIPIWSFLKNLILI